MQNSRAAYRIIQPDDIPAIFDVRIATWHNENGQQELTQMGITHDSVIEQMRSTHRGWLCEVDGKIVGFAMGNHATAEMWVIAVLSEYENRGIGRTLLTDVENWLFEKGHRNLWLTTDIDENFRAVGFYRRCGWRDWKIEGGNRYMKKTRPDS